MRGYDEWRTAHPWDEDWDDEEVEEEEDEGYDTIKERELDGF